MELEREVQVILEKYELDGLDSTALRDLLAHAQRNDQSSFFRGLRSLLGGGHPALAYEKALWVDLVSLMVGSQYTATEFDLPPSSRAANGVEGPFPIHQTSLVVDDGTETVAVLKGALLADESMLSAILWVYHAERDFPIPADRITLDPITGDVKIHLPSLEGLGVSEGAARPGSLRLQILHHERSFVFEALYLRKVVPQKD